MGGQEGISQEGRRVVLGDKRRDLGLQREERREEAFLATGC